MKNNTVIAEMGRMTNGAHGVVDLAAEAAGGATDNAERKARTAIDSAAQAAHQIVENSASTLTPAVEWLGDRADAAMAHQRQLTHSGRNAVINHPWKALGLALVAGFVISRVLR